MNPSDPMKIMSENCRGFGGPFTISQLKESTWLNLLDVTFVCKTKQTRNFTEIVCKKMKLGSRWMTGDPVGGSGGIWSEQVQVKIMESINFSIELHVCPL